MSAVITSTGALPSAGVVNNNSRDHTPRVVEEFGRTASVPVRYLFEGKAGKSRALNAGIALATHDFLLFTGDDVLTSRAWVASAVLAMARWGADGVGGRILLKCPAPIWPTVEFTIQTAKRDATRTSRPTISR